MAIDLKDTHAVLDECAFLVGRMDAEPRIRVLTSLCIRQSMSVRRSLTRTMLRTFFLGQSPIERAALVDNLIADVRDASQPVARPAGARGEAMS